MSIGCYTEPYLPASFKAVPFVAIEATSEHGRNGAEGEFPFNESTAYADISRKIRKYTLRARFAENSHVLDAALLIAAVELKGPGPLVHPTRGVIVSAACTKIKTTDKIEEEGGVTYVDLEFVEANVWPNGLSLVGQLLGLAIAPIITQARTHFNANYAPTEIQAFRSAAVVAFAQDQVELITTQYIAATSTTLANDRDRNRIVYDLQSVASNTDLGADPTTMDRALALGMNAVAQNVSGSDKFDVFRTLANGAAGVSTFNTPASTAENSIYVLIRVAAAAYMAEGALESDEYRTGQLFAQLDVINAVLDEEKLNARNICDNALFIALSDFQIDVGAQLSEKAYNAPGLVEYDFGGQVHPLVAAYAIHGDAKKHRSLEELNVVGRLGRMGPTVVGTRTGI